MLRNIKLIHFKCFEQLELNCKQLNLLCGLNGMGKSSVIQALLVLRQSFEIGELLAGRLALNGERVAMGTGADVLFEDAEHDVLEFVLESDETEIPWEMEFDCLRTSMADILDTSSSRARAIKSQIDEEVDKFLKEHLDKDQSQIDEEVHQIYREVFTKFSYMPIGWSDMPPFGGDLVYINAGRVGSRQLYPVSTDVLTRRGDFGESGEYAWDHLSRHQNDLLQADDPRFVEGSDRRLSTVVDHWLQDICPGAHLHLEEVRAADAVIAGFTFDREDDVASRRHRATNVGFGLSYALPVILALLSKPGTLCLIENPEAHLHPRGQTKLAELAARASKAGVQVIAETHSDHFMDGVRIAVRDGLIEPEDAAFHYFERKGNQTVVTSPQIDSDGRLSSWPIGFFDQHDDNLARLLAPKE